MLTKQTKILIVGLGLLGGSYAKGLSEAGFTVGGLDISEKAVAFAVQKGYIADGRAHLDGDFIGRYDLIVFALYPSAFLSWLQENQGFLKRGALLTDVLGVKGPVVERAQSLLREDLEYIAAHPMAGRELSGIAYANTEMFKKANYIVTPTEKNTETAIETCKDIGRVLGFSSISTLSPREHDEMIGFLSQLTHCIAVSLMTAKDAEHLALYTGDSFRDLTRIAKINDEMWSELFLLNKDVLLKEMDAFSEKFALMREAIATGDRDALREMMRLSTRRRTFFDNNEPKG